MHLFYCVTCLRLMNQYTFSVETGEWYWHAMNFLYFSVKLNIPMYLEEIYDLKWTWCVPKVGVIPFDFNRTDHLKSVFLPKQIHLCYIVMHVLTYLMCLQADNLLAVASVSFSEGLASTLADFWRTAVSGGYFEF